MTPPVPARRHRQQAWRDPRLWIGLAIVSASVLLGARVLAGADDATAVWALRHDLGPGARLTSADLEVRRVRFADASATEAYWPADADPPDGQSLRRGVGAGELLPRAAVGQSAADLVEVPLAVSADLVPASLESGAVVDVYLLGVRGENRVLDDVTVLDAGESADGYVASDTRRLVVAVPAQQTEAFFERIGSLSDPRLTVTREPS